MRGKVDDPAAENVWIGSAASLLVGSLILAGHAWFLFYLEEEYRSVYAATPNATSTRDYVQIWVPIFLSTIALEMVYFWIFYPSARVYRTNDALGSLMLGSFNQLTKKLLSQIVFLDGPYIWVWLNYGQYLAAQIPILQNHFVAWWLMFVGVDFAYYWVHRTGHTINAFWALHGVHHSSEEYNLTTALRQSSFHQLVSWCYYVPLALLFPPPLLFLHNQFNLLYQYWIHTRAIGKLGPLEWIFNTPSQHRVHHGRNAYCIDRNYGGTLCIFDRLFGTFQEEIEEVPVVYGLTHSLNTFEPIKGNTLAWSAIWKNIVSVKGLKYKFLCLYDGPGRIPGSEPAQHYPIPPCTRGTAHKYDTTLSSAAQLFAIAMFLFATMGSQVAYVIMSSESHYWYSLVGVMYFAFLFICMGLICDQDARAGIALIVAHFIGMGYMIYGILSYLPPPYETYQSLLLGGVGAFGLFSLLLSVAFIGVRVDRSGVKLGYDEPTAPEVEKAQWELCKTKPLKAE